jgi:hypothetical protein
LTDKGGHIAWHEGIKERWYPKPAMEFIELSKVIKPDKEPEKETLKTKAVEIWDWIKSKFKI